MVYGLPRLKTVEKSWYSTNAAAEEGGECGEWNEIAIWINTGSS